MLYRFAFQFVWIKMLCHLVTLLYIHPHINSHTDLKVNTITYISLIGLLMVRISQSPKMDLTRQLNITHESFPVLYRIFLSTATRIMASGETGTIAIQM